MISNKKVFLFYNFGYIVCFGKTCQKDRRMKGNVKMFNAEKGFGFIHAEDGNDYFFHYSAILMDGYKTLDKGAAVEFEVEPSERGLRACKVKKAD